MLCGVCGLLLQELDAAITQYKATWKVIPGDADEGRRLLDMSCWLQQRGTSSRERWPFCVGCIAVTLSASEVVATASGSAVLPKCNRMTIPGLPILSVVYVVLQVRAVEVLLVRTDTGVY